MNACKAEGEGQSQSQYQDQTVNIIGSVGHLASATTAQLIQCSPKVAIDHSECELACLCSSKIYLNK